MNIAPLPTQLRTAHDRIYRLWFVALRNAPREIAVVTIAGLKPHTVRRGAAAHGLALQFVGAVGANLGVTAPRPISPGLLI